MLVSERVVHVVRRVINEREISLKQVSLDCKLNSGHVSRIMSGMRPEISIKTVEKLFKGLGIKYSELDKEESWQFQSKVSDSTLLPSQETRFTT